MIVTLETVKAQLKIDHDNDDQLLREHMSNALSYAEQYQGKSYIGSAPNEMRGTTRQAILLLITSWYENRDGVSARQTSANTKDPVIEAVNRLLYFDRSVRI